MDRVTELLGLVSQDYSDWWDKDGKKAFDLIIKTAPDDAYARAKLMGFIAFTHGQTNRLVELKDEKKPSGEHKVVTGPGPDVPVG